MNHSNLSKDSEVVQNEGNLVSDMNGEKVMLNIGNGKYYNLGEIGGAIWDLIEKPLAVNEIIKSLMKNYAVKEPECEDHVLSFIKQLGEEKLISIKK